MQFPLSLLIKNPSANGIFRQSVTCSWIGVEIFLAPSAPFLFLRLNCDGALISMQSYSRIDAQILGSHIRIWGWFLELRGWLWVLREWSWGLISAVLHSDRRANLESHTRIGGWFWELRAWLQVLCEWAWGWFLQSWGWFQWCWGWSIHCWS